MSGLFLLALYGTCLLLAGSEQERESTMTTATEIHKEYGTGSPWQEKISLEFHTKNRILNDAFTPTAQMDYIYRVWGGKDEERMTILLQRYEKIHDGSWKGTYFKILIDEIFDLLLFRDDLYSYYTDFRNGKVGIKTVEKVRAFCIDLDHMSPVDLKRLVKRKLGIMEHPPTYIVNSGNGIHLVYLFKEPIDVSEGGRIFGMKNLLRELTHQFEPQKGYGYKLDSQSANLIQPYRVPGSQTKNGDVSRVYKSGPEYKLQVLEDWLGYKVFSSPSHDSNMDRSQKSTKVKPFPKGKPHFYHYCLEKVRTPDKHNRYLVMFGLAIVAWKCRIPKEELLQDLKELLHYYNCHAAGNPGG